MVNLKIDLFTTPGCEACNIMKNILNNSVELYKSAAYVNIDYSIIEIEPNDGGNRIAKLHSIKDYPTTEIYIHDLNKNPEDISSRLIGTYPKDYICKVIDNFIDSSI